MSDTSLPTIVQQPPASLPATMSPGGMLFDPNRFEFAQRVANMFAHSQLVPQHLQGKVADCAIALHMAERLGEDPLVVMQNINIINGRAGWSAQYMIGRANRSGQIKGRIGWRTEGSGDSLKVTAFAVLADTGEEIASTATMAMAKAEGWTRNAKYNSMPEHMLRWRSATMLIRLYMPEIMLGIPAADEVEDVGYGVTGYTDLPAAPPPPPARPHIATVATQPASTAPTASEPPPPPEPPTIDAEVMVEDAAAGEDDPAAPDAAYELVTADGQVLAWALGQEANFVTAFITELRNAAKRGRPALDGLWETNADSLIGVPEAVDKEVRAEHQRLITVLEREAAKGADSAAPRTRKAAEPKPAPEPVGAAPAQPPAEPAGGAADLF